MIKNLIESVGKLAGVTKEASGVELGKAVSSTAAGANKDSVNKIIAGIREIIEIANNSDVKIEPRNGGETVTAEANNAVAVLAKTGSDENTHAVKLESKVVKADPWAIIEKIKSSKDATGGTLTNSGVDHDAGDLVTKTITGNNAGAKSIADVAAAVALKAMTKDGQFNATTNEVVKGAAISAVNKVLGVLDEIIRKTVNNELVKIKDAVKGIKYSETTGEVTEVKK